MNKTKAPLILSKAATFRRLTERLASAGVLRFSQPLLITLTPKRPRLKHAAPFFRVTNSLVCLAALLCLHASPLKGQTPRLDEDTVSVGFSALSLGGTITNGYYDDSSGSQALTVTNAARTQRMQYRGPPNLVFYRMEQGPDGQAIKVPFASVDLQGKSGEWLLLFQPQGDGRFRVSAVRDDLGDFPNGTWRVFNLTSSSLAFLAGEGSNPELLAPGANHTFPAINGQKGNEHVQIAIHHKDTWKRVYSSLWGRRTDTRTLVFLTPRGDDGAIAVRRINLNM